VRQELTSDSNELEWYVQIFRRSDRERNSAFNVQREE